MKIDARLLEILVCVESKEPLVYFEEEERLFCPASRLLYRVDDGVPVMLVDEAERLSEEEADSLERRARDLGMLGE